MTVPRRNPSAGDRAGAGNFQWPRAAGSKRSTGEVEAQASRLVVRTQPSQALRLRSRKVGVSGRPTVVKNGSRTDISLDLARDPEPVDGLPVPSKIQSKMDVPPVCRGRTSTPLGNHAFQWQ